MPTLRELEGEITSINYGEGVVLSAVMFICPVCPGGHAHVIPYADEPFHEVANPVDGERPIKVWQRVSGSTIDDITLSPSYLVLSCSNFHGHVVAGEWRAC